MTEEDRRRTHDECHACGQPDPVRLYHLLRTSLTTRRVPGFVWITVVMRACWDRPQHQSLYRGIVQRYAFGPVVVMTMPTRVEPLPPLGKEGRRFTQRLAAEARSVRLRRIARQVLDEDRDYDEARR